MATVRATGKKNAVQSDCVKSTPKEEGGGDTIWIGARLDDLNCGVIDPTGTHYADAQHLPQHFFVQRRTKVLIFSLNLFIDTQYSDLTQLLIVGSRHAPPLRRTPTMTESCNLCATSIRPRIANTPHERRGHPRHAGFLAASTKRRPQPPWWWPCRAAVTSSPSIRTSSTGPPRGADRNGMHDQMA